MGRGQAQNNRQQLQQPIFSELMKKVSDGEVESATVNSTTGEVTGKYKGTDTEFRSNVPAGSYGVYEKLIEKMLDKGVKVTAQKEGGNQWVSLLVNAIPFVLLLAFWIFMMRQMQSGGNKALSFGKARGPALHSTRNRRKSHLRMWLESRKPRKNCRRSSISCVNRRSSRSSVDAFRKACC